MWNDNPVSNQKSLSIFRLRQSMKSWLLKQRGCDCKVVTKSQIPVQNVIFVQNTKANHLDHSLNTDYKDSIGSAAIAQIWSSFNLFRAEFGHIQPYVQCKLCKQFYCSFYEVLLWFIV